MPKLSTVGTFNAQWNNLQMFPTKQKKCCKNYIRVIEKDSKIVFQNVGCFTRMVERIRGWFADRFTFLCQKGWCNRTKDYYVAKKIEQLFTSQIAKEETSSDLTTKKVTTTFTRIKGLFSNKKSKKLFEDACVRATAPLHKAEQAAQELAKQQEKQRVVSSYQEGLRLVQKGSYAKVYEKVAAFQKDGTHLRAYYLLIALSEKGEAKAFQKLAEMYADGTASETEKPAQTMAAWAYEKAGMNEKAASLRAEADQPKKELRDYLPQIIGLLPRDSKGAKKPEEVFWKEECARIRGEYCFQVIEDSPLAIYWERAIQIGEQLDKGSSFARLAFCSVIGNQKGIERVTKARKRHESIDVYHLPLKKEEREKQLEAIKEGLSKTKFVEITVERRVVEGKTVQTSRLVFNKEWDEEVHRKLPNDAEAYLVVSKGLSSFAEKEQELEKRLGLFIRAYQLAKKARDLGNKETVLQFNFLKKGLRPLLRQLSQKARNNPMLGLIAQFEKLFTLDEEARGPVLDKLCGEGASQIKPLALESCTPKLMPFKDKFIALAKLFGAFSGVMEEAVAGDFGDVEAQKRFLTLLADCAAFAKELPELMENEKLLAFAEQTPLAPFLTLLQDKEFVQAVVVELEKFSSTLKEFYKASAE